SLPRPMDHPATRPRGSAACRPRSAATAFAASPTRPAVVASDRPRRRDERRISTRVGAVAAIELAVPILLRRLEEQRVRGENAHAAVVPENGLGLAGGSQRERALEQAERLEEGIVRAAPRALLELRLAAPLPSDAGVVNAIEFRLQPGEHRE